MYPKLDVCWKSLKKIYLGVYDTLVIFMIEVPYLWWEDLSSENL